MRNARNTILISTAILLAVGLIMNYSATGTRSFQVHGDATFLPRKHLLFVTLAVAALLTFTLIDYRRLRAAALPTLGVTALLLGLVLVPTIGSEINAARRWFRIGSLSFQPSELAKFTAILVVAALACRKPGIVRDFKRGFLPITVVVGGLALLIVAERDAGTPLFLVTVCAIILLFAGAKAKHFAPYAGLAGLALVGAIAFGMATQNWVHISTRVGEYWHAVRYGEAADPSGSGYQITQSLLALGSGGLEGRGLGRGMQKLGYLPEQHTDFIFAIIGEELGFIGATLVVATFASFTFAGFQIAKRASSDPFAAILAYGITLIIGMQAAANIAVVTHLVPTKGIGLPFISKGGSAILVQCCAVGILINIANRFIESENNEDVAVGVS